MEHFKASEDHEDKLSKYATMAYISCIGEMIKLMTKKGIGATVLVLIEAKNSYGPLPSPF